MKLSIEEKKILYAFGCGSHENTVRRLKWVTALTVDEKVKRRVLCLARKLDDGGAGEWYPCFYRHLRLEMESYFEAKKYILPLDAVLYAEITKGHDHLKRCCECGASFTPKSNRAKYCPACAKKLRRRKEAERQRKRYHHQQISLKKFLDF